MVKNDLLLLSIANTSAKPNCASFEYGGYAAHVDGSRTEHIVRKSRN